MGNDRDNSGEHVHAATAMSWRRAQ